MPIYIGIRLERCWMHALSASEQKVECSVWETVGWLDWIAPRLFDYWSKGGANNQECFHKVDKQTEGHTQSDK